MMGSVDSICSDKTGTLTLNKMHLKTIWEYGRGYINTAEYINSEKDAFQNLIPNKEL